MIRSVKQQHPGVQALLALGLWLSPGIPFAIWVWPRVDGAIYWILQILAYSYIAAGTLLIGLRHWSPRELGFNRHGFWLSLLCGLGLLAGRTLVILAVSWPRSRPPLTPAIAARDVAFYFLLVGVIEELTYRGLVFRALLDWRGARWAIWGSAVAFSLFHIGWGSGLQLLGGLLIGLILAVIRWRAGGILGLILVHGAIDVGTVWLLPEVDLQALGRPEIASFPLLLLGYGLLAAVPLVLWLGYPRWRVSHTASPNHLVESREVRS